MARPILAIRDCRGSVVVEAISAFSIVSCAIIGLLFSGYLIFAQIWLNYQLEESLHCLAEGLSPYICKLRYSRRITHFLPYGKIQMIILQSKESQKWNGKVVWKLNHLTMSHQRTLSMASIVHNTDLSW